MKRASFTGSDLKALCLLEYTALRVCELCFSGDASECLRQNVHCLSLLFVRHVFKAMDSISFCSLNPFFPLSCQLTFLALNIFVDSQFKSHTPTHTSSRRKNENPLEVLENDR